MHRRSLYRALALGLLVCLTIFVGALPAGAASTHPRPQQNTHPYQSVGHKTASPVRVSTSTVPQTKGHGNGTLAARPAPGGRNNVPDTANVKIAPAAPRGSNMTVSKTFEGQDNTGWSPSDSNGAPGKKNFVETVNEQFEVYSKTGVAQYGTSFNSWFGVSGSLFDPKTIWDTNGNRFLFLIDTGSSFIISVAQQTSAVGNYCNYTFPTISGDFADFPQLGIDANGVYFTGNMYGTPFSVELFDASRTSMESCTTASYTYWTGLTDPGGGSAFAVVPSVVYSNDGNVEYMVDSN